MSNGLFDDKDIPVIDPDKDYFTELVGEGKKFKDEKSLARSKVEADEFIRSLTREMSELKQELNTRARLEDLLTKVSEPKMPPSNPGNQPPNEENQPPASGLTADQLEEVLNKKLNEREVKSTRERNVQSIKSELASKFGNGYVDVLKAKATELGVSSDWMNSLAADNPKALLKLVGADTVALKPNDLFSAPPSSQTSTGFVPNNQDRTQSWYNELKKKDAKLYWHKDTQVALHKDAMRLGERFFS